MVKPLPDTAQARQRPWARRIGAGLAIALACIVGATVALLALIDHGALDGPIARWASSRLERPVRFDRLRTHLLSRHPEISMDGLRIGNPGWLPEGDAARIARVTVRFRFLPLLGGQVDIPSLTIERPVLHLIRVGPRRNNWSITHDGKNGPAFAPLRGVGRFVVSDGILRFHDYARDLFVQGTFDLAGPAQQPFRMRGAGTYKGGAVRFAAKGGAIHGDAVGRPYPFLFDMIDGATTLHAQGTSKDPFDLSQYALSVRARGPNLANIGYLFNLITPNSAPFTLTTRAFSDGRHLRFDRLRVAMGASRIAGQISADHGGPRRAIVASFDAPRLARADIDAILSTVPPRAEARVRSGAVTPGLASRWLLSNAPFGLRRMRGADFDFHIHVDTLTGYALPLTDVATRIDLDHGLLNVPAFAARLYSGRVNGAGSLDARTETPLLKAKAVMTGLRLADAAAAKSPMQGRLDLRFDLAGRGRSLHLAAGTASGTAGFSLTGATVPRPAAYILGGDMLRAALAGRNGAVALDCATGDLKGANGRLDVRNLALGTAMGSASGSGTIDLGAERLALVLNGRAARRRLFQVAAPIRIEGPWLRPVVSVLPGHNARKLGLKGKAGLILTPLAGLLPLGKDSTPAATCR